MTNTYPDITGALQVREIENSTFLNSIVYGSNVEEFQLEFNDALTPQVTFDRFLVRTESPASYFNNNPNWFPTPEFVYRNQAPGFVSTEDRNFRLTAGAFARNRGINTPVFFDIEGTPRDCDGDGFVDLGCFAYCP
jgi:hypothetical protein